MPDEGNESGTPEAGKKLTPEELYYSKVHCLQGLVELQIMMCHARSLEDVSWNRKQGCGELFCDLTAQFLDLMDR